MAKRGTSKASYVSKAKPEEEKALKIRCRKLSPEEKSKYWASGKCFNCGEMGHLVHNCLVGCTGMSSQASKPSSLKSYSVKMDLHKTNHFREEALAVWWKTPTNCNFLRRFLDAAGYLANDISCTCIPMGVLHSLTRDTIPFCWEFTHQRAFKDIKQLASKCQDHHRTSLAYGKDQPPVNMIMDKYVTGIAEVICQEEDWITARVTAFF